ncbi:hypothetical protein MMC15_006779 [Xylographa vitiligo]|nr:hypothetical protein [Xylographa vitiligo]
MALAAATRVLGQDTTGNPLNVFISVAGGAVTVIETAVATQSAPSASSTTPASARASTTSAGPAATSTTAAAAAAAASSGGLSHQTLLDIIIPVVVIGVLFLALLALCIYCCLRRRRRSRRTPTPVADDEVTTWRRPENPGRTYEPHPIPMSQQPTVPLMAATTTERPYTADHPAFRNPNTDNPFVPPPPQPRRTAPNSRAGLTDGTVAGAPAFVDTSPAAGPSRLRKSRSTSRSTSGAGLHDSYTGPHGNTSSAYPNPYPNAGPVGAGLNDPYDKFAVPPGHYYNQYGELVVPAFEHGNHDPYGASSADRPARTPLLPTPHTTSTTPAATASRDRPPTPFGLSTLSSTPPPPTTTTTARPPPSPYARIGSPYTDLHVHHLQTDRPSVHLLHTAPTTPPLLPSRSPNRRSAFHDSAYDSFGSGAGGEHTPASVDSRSGSGSGSASAESWQTTHTQMQMQMQPPPAAPWEDRGRRYSGSQRGSWGRGEGWGGGRGGGTPPTGGGGRRLRFSDVEGEGMGRRLSQGVGEAL